MQLPKSRISPAQALLAVAVLVLAGALVVVGMAFWRQVALSREMGAVAAQLEEQVEAQRVHQEELQRRLEYVQSDEYVEEWARTKARMAKPGEVPVVVLAATAAPTAQPVGPARSEALPTPGFWERLWRAIRGD